MPANYLQGLVAPLNNVPVLGGLLNGAAGAGDFFGNAIDSGGRTISDMLNPHPTTPGWSDAEIQDVTTRLQAMHLPQAQIDNVLARAQDGTLSYADAVGKFVEPGELAHKQLGRLNELQTTTEKPLNDTIGRLSGIVSNPSAIKTDAEYGKILSDAENTLNAGYQGVRRNIAHMDEASGGGYSGRGIDLSQRAQMGLSSSLAGVQGGLYSDILGRRDSTQSELSASKQGYEGQRTQLESGIPLQSTIGDTSTGNWMRNSGINQSGLSTATNLGNTALSNIFQASSLPGAQLNQVSQFGRALTGNVK